MSHYLREVDFIFLLSSSKMLLFFNLLPIYPLDGGKLLFLILSFLDKAQFDLLSNEKNRQLNNDPIHELELKR